MPSKKRASSNPICQNCACQNPTPTIPLPDYVWETLILQSISREFITKQTKRIRELFQHISRRMEETVGEMFYLARDNRDEDQQKLVVLLNKIHTLAWEITELARHTQKLERIVVAGLDLEGGRA